ncbi:MAG: hypothetical protein QXD43_01430 [Candidatus Aenigmatarchaeota archaeon]
MVCPPGTACPLTAFGLPEILLWVLSFAVVFGILSKLKIFPGRAAAALISIAVGFLVLMAVPAALITVIAGMSTALLVVGIGFFVLLALIEITGTQKIIKSKDKEGNEILSPVHPFKAHSTLVTIAILVIAGIIFYVSGGWALLGLGALPAISAGTWLLIIVGAAVLWMLSGA